MATIADVAKLAGVSTATVSRVVNRTAYVQPATLERVEKAIATLNYQRDARAAALAKRSSQTIGLLTGNLADPFFALIAKHVEAVAREQQCQLVVVSGGHDAKREKEGLDHLISQGCEAMVVHSKMLDNATLIRYAAQLPALVLLNRCIPELAHRSVWLDNRTAASLAVENLINQGHRHIACITTNLPIEDRAERLAGYYDAMEKAGLEVRPGWVISHNFVEEGGEAAGLQLLIDCPTVTGVVTFNDVMAAGLMACLQEHGVNVPHDMSVVGFDDVLLAKYLYPRLSTIHYPIEKMSRYAATLALDFHNQREIVPANHEFQAHLVARNTVSTPRSDTEQA